MRLWFYHDGVWLCAPPKCGGTMLYRLVLGINCADHHETFSRAQEATVFRSPEGISRPAFLAVRDPVERFMSLWRDKCRDGDANLPELKGLSPSELMKKIECSWHGDPHWVPQADFHRAGVQCVPYDQMIRWFQGTTYARNAPVNFTVRHPDDPLPPTTRIIRHYWKDMELCYG